MQIWTHNHTKSPGREVSPLLLSHPLTSEEQLEMNVHVTLGCQAPTHPENTRRLGKEARG